MTARSRRNERSRKEATQFDTEMAAPVFETRTPTGTGALTPERVRMEAGRFGDSQPSGGNDSERLPLVGDEINVVNRPENLSRKAAVYKDVFRPPVGRARTVSSSDQEIVVDTGGPSHGSRDREGAV